ncbi:MAG TPA: tetratricopeptide repeat protein, partial [Rhizobiales bacterium]|nr:tetratricopeptide repeat protein [Hyphomicrobiales bacterium]
RRLSADSAQAAGEAPAGPSAQDVAAAEAMTPADRMAMIETMVAGLDERLRQNPADGEGWQRLIRSYVVLGRKDDALDALKRAGEAFPADTQEARAIAALAAELGLVKTE